MDKVSLIYPSELGTGTGTGTGTEITTTFQEPTEIVSIEENICEPEIGVLFISDKTSICDLKYFLNTYQQRRIVAVFNKRGTKHRYKINRYLEEKNIRSYGYLAKAIPSKF